MSKIKFCVFSDYHYFPDGYPIGQQGIDIIFDKAYKNNVDCIIHCGDFSAQSTADDGFLQKYINNKYNIPAFGCYGNHELERVESLEELNRVYGIKKSYYYKDISGFRLIIIDTNHWKDDDGTFYHYPGKGVGSPKGWSYDQNLMGDEQLKWFENTVISSKFPCIVVGHNPINKSNIEEHKRTLGIINKINYDCPGKILMFLSGHIHRNNIEIINNVVYFNVNATFNGEWVPSKHTLFPKEFCKGHYMADNCAYFKDPLSAIVTVEDNGHIIIDGMETDYLFGVSPEMFGGPFPNSFGICEPRISSATFKLFVKKPI